MMTFLNPIRRTMKEYIGRLRLHGVEPNKIDLPHSLFKKLTITRGQKHAWEFEIVGESQKPHTVLIKGYTDASAEKIGIYHAEFHNCDFSNDVSLLLECTENATIIFANCLFQKKFKIRNVEEGKYEDQQKNKVELKKLEFIDCTMESVGSKTTPFLRVGFLHVKEFVLRNLRIPNDAEVNIGDCHFENFQLSNIRNLGKLKLYRINVLENERYNSTLFQIDNTSIGDADFQSIDLSTFAEKKMFDNIFSDLDYTNVAWGNHENDEVQVGQFHDEAMKLWKQRDSYRVLKNVALKNNDIQPALAFFAKEMKFHREVTKKNFGLWSQEGIILEFSRLTNNFGMSWIRPIIWIVGLGVAFYSTLLISLNGGYIFVSAAEWIVNSIAEQKTWEEALLELWSLVKSNTATLGKFFVFLNPTHSTEFIAKDWGFWAYTIDFFFRIIEGALIYQAIQVFRRYTRKF